MSMLEQYIRTDDRVKRRARLMLWLTPFSVAGGGLCFLWLLDALQVVSWPAGSFGAQFDFWTFTVALTLASIVALTFPALGVVLAIAATRREGPTAQGTLSAAWVVFTLVAFVFGIIGALVWGVVIYLLQRRVVARV